MSDIILQVGVKILLKNPEGKYLLLRRSESKYGQTDGVWDIVGGRIDPGSPLLDNLRREIKEETSLELLGEPKLLAAQDILRVPGRHVVRLTYVGETRGKPVLDETENVEYRWFDRKEMEELGSGLDVYFREVLRNL